MPRFSALSATVALFLVVAFALFFAVSPTAAYVPPGPKGDYAFWEPFIDLSQWTIMDHDPSDPSKHVMKLNLAPAKKDEGIYGDLGLEIPLPAHHYAGSAPFPSPYHSTGKGLAVQYELRMQEGWDCGGGYIKLLTHPYEPSKFTNKTPYTIMFGPDKCGMDSKVHFIIRHKNPKTGEFEEKHMTAPPTPKNDKITHLYSLVVEEDNDFEIFIDQESVRKGNLLTEGDFNPSINPPKTIDDPSDKKPADWVDDEEIPDPSATKPDDWDESAPMYLPDKEAVKPDDWLESEPKEVPDANAKKPDDWDDDLDGEWEPPTIANAKCETVSGCGKWERPEIYNPEYKGKWSPPLIPNPAYKGAWKARQIPNPDYWEDLHPAHFAPIGGVGIEVWQMNAGPLFDNILVASTYDTLKEYADKTFRPKYEHEKAIVKEQGEDIDEPEDGVFAQFQEFAEMVMSWATRSPLVAAALVTAVVVPLFTCFFLGATMSSKKAAAPATASPAQSTASTPAATATDDSASSTSAASSSSGGASPKKAKPRKPAKTH